MLVYMTFGDVKPNPDGHQPARQNKGEGYRVAKQGNGNDCADEGGSGEIRPRPGGAEFPEGDNKQHKADPIPQKADNAGHHDVACGWNRHPDNQRETNICCARNQSLDRGNLKRVG